ncbi:MAG: hypothetical protein AAB305_03925 [Candidatus Zixiibacteriota bacterium]
MSVQKFAVCDRCSNVVTSPDKGFTIKGNVYAAATSDRPVCLVGNNFPRINGMAFKVEEITETHLCHDCMLSALGLEVHVAHKNKALATKSA